MVKFLLTAIILNNLPMAPGSVNRLWNFDFLFSILVQDLKALLADLSKHFYDGLMITKISLLWVFVVFNNRWFHNFEEWHYETHSILILLFGHNNCFILLYIINEFLSLIAIKLYTPISEELLTSESSFLFINHRKAVSFALQF